MLNIFISYHHQCEAIVRTLVEDIEVLGHTVWFDEELSGGQAWWDQILAKIRDCDVLVFVLAPESLNSTPCNREYGYAADLGKPILPILVAEGVSPSLLPPKLSKIQFVDYRKQDRDSAFRLAKAFTTVRPPIPLPEPLPDPPEVPITYLGSLTEKMELKTALSYEEQSTLVIDLKRSLRDPETTDDARTLLDRLRKRRDLFASIAEEIDELLTSTLPERELQDTQKVNDAIVKTPSEVGGRPPEAQITQLTTTHSPPTATRPTTTVRERLICTLVGAVLGTTVGLVTIAMTYPEDWPWGLFTGAGGAIAGAISGTNRRVIVAVIIGAVFGLFVVINIAKFAVGIVLGAPSGATLGAISGVILRKLKKWP